MKSKEKKQPIHFLKISLPNFESNFFLKLKVEENVIARLYPALNSTI